MLSRRLPQLPIQDVILPEKMVRQGGSNVFRALPKEPNLVGPFKRGRMLGCIISAGLACQLLGAASGQVGADKGQSRYTITDLGTLGGRFSSASDINESGQIVGVSNLLGDTVSHAFLYSNGIMKDLKTLGGTFSDASAINNSGQVVGDASLTGDTASHAFLYRNGTMTDLGTLPGGSLSQAHAINNHGEIVGGADTVDFAFHVFLSRNGTMSDLAVRVGDSSSFSSAFGINDSRQVAVDTIVSTVNGSQQHAVLYIGSTIQDLGVLKGHNFSFVRGINNSGQIVGGSSNGDTTRAFLYRNGKMKDLGTLGGSLTRADGINNRDQIVGFSLTRGDDAVHGFLFSEDKMQDLNKLVPAHSGWTLGEAFAINDNGQIVGSGTAPNGENRAFLLTLRHRW